MKKLNIRSHYDRCGGPMWSFEYLATKKPLSSIMSLIPPFVGKKNGDKLMPVYGYRPFNKMNPLGYEIKKYFVDYEGRFKPCLNKKYVYDTIQEFEEKFG